MPTEPLWLTAIVGLTAIVLGWIQRDVKASRLLLMDQRDLVHDLRGEIAGLKAEIIILRSRLQEKLDENLTLLRKIAKMNGQE